MDFRVPHLRESSQNNRLETRNRLSNSIRDQIPEPLFLASVSRTSLGERIAIFLPVRYPEGSDFRRIEGL